MLHPWSQYFHSLYIINPGNVTTYLQLKSNHAEIDIPIISYYDYIYAEIDISIISYYDYI